MALDWKSVYASMHREGEAAFPPAALYYVLQRVRKQAAPAKTSDATGIPVLTPAEIIATFRKGVRADFGPLAREVLDEWNLRTPGELGRAIELLGRYQCLSLDPSDTPEAFAADVLPLHMPFSGGELIP